MYKLVIAEKPSVARAIAAVIGANVKNDGYYSGNGYVVSWCFGHLVGLSYPDDYGEQWSGKWNIAMLPMIPSDWKFKINKDCRKQFALLRTMLNNSKISEVICATDADREGECIFRYVYNLSHSSKPVKRLWVSSLETSAIKNGFLNLKPSSMYDSVFSAGYSRSKADWLVGMNGSRLFTCRYGSRLTLGRVQTPTLSMIVNRDSIIKSFTKQQYFTVETNFGDFKASTDKIESADKAKKLCEDLYGKTAIVASYSTKSITLNPPCLYDLTTLQREANSIFGYTAKQTLDYLQALYEAKLSTYPRTDSQFISNDMKQTALNVIKAVFTTSIINTGLKNIMFEPNLDYIIDDEMVTGHHAIIPTINVSSTDLASLPEGQKNILRLISLKLIMATALPHKYLSVKAKLLCNDIELFANDTMVINKGWKYFESLNRSETSVKDVQSLPKLSEGQSYIIRSLEVKEHWTSPPKHFTENTLLSAMEHAGIDDYVENGDNLPDIEKKGLGTPATRAAIIEGLIKNGYAERKKKQIIATEKGISLISVVPEEVKSPKLTAEWEIKLQKIERGEYSADVFMADIEGFVTDLCNKYGTESRSDKFKSKNAPIGACPNCGKNVINGKYGFFCSGKCGMRVATAIGKNLSEAQIVKLLNGQKTAIMSGRSIVKIIPEIEQINNKGKIYYQWKTE